ncbi:hypothetical protein ASPFODRAFT_522109 [Aspergillus luchuensis CBS 106.47]|uniref:Uncharacterized protein n=1 Tax=Aspergillus luchuensis (strain CBS 106.47) TaxID=1137211 RepID=A0A1M3TMA2_ASPLC|nr:hypothetical protein ASPFODRAFT_522109 [Aspergillus luchuensis CBS 106.47]
MSKNFICSKFAKSNMDRYSQLLAVLSYVIYYKVTEGLIRCHWYPSTNQVSFFIHSHLNMETKAIS